MKIGVMMCAYHEESKIAASIHQFDGLVDEVVAAVSKHPWYGTGEPDNTAKLALEAGAVVKLYHWLDEKDQKNWIMSKLQYMDWIIMSAPDMFMTEESIRNLTYQLAVSKDRAHACLMKTYWKNTHRVIVPDEINCNEIFNTVAIRPKEVFEYSARFKDYAYFKPLDGVTVHHLSWVKTDGEMKEKISTWSHAPEVIDNWYEECWLKDTEPIKYISNSSNTFKTAKYDLPDEIRNKLDQKWLRKAER